MSTRLINVTSIEQGTISDSGNQNSSTRVRSAGRYAVNLGQQIKISVESNSNIKTNVMLYADSTTNRALWDSGWFDNGESIDITRYTDDAKYIRICLKKSNNSNISPEDIVSCRVEVVELEEFAYDWQIIDGEITNRNFISMPEKYMENPYPAALWRIDPAVNNGYPYHELLPDIRGIDLWAIERKYQIHVYDMHEPQSGFDGNGLAILDPVSCTSLHNDERWEIEMHHPIDDWGKWKNLLVSNVLKVDGQLFRIDVSEPEIGESGREMYVHAKHISQDMADMLIINETFRGGNAEAFIDFCFSKYFKAGSTGYSYFQFEGHSDIETICDSSDYINTSVWAAMVGADNCLINRYGGELYRDNFYFSINKRMQYAKDNAFYLRYSLDMVKIDQRVDYTDFCTHLICYDNYGSMWSVADETGWIRTRVHHPIVRMAQFNYPEYEGAFQQLMIDGFNLWLQVSVPKITYDVQLAALKNDPRYADFLELQNYNYGDSGTIYCPELDIETEQKITEVEKDELTGDITRMILGNLRNSVTRPDYLGSTITSGRSPADKQSKAVQEQLYELAFETLILTPITTSDGKYLTTADGKYIQYRSD